MQFFNSLTKFFLTFSSHHRPFLLLVHCCLFQSLFAVNDFIVDAPPPSKKTGVIRVTAPGIFDYQSSDYIVRMRAWGVSFPQRGQAGYEEAISFSESNLLDNNISLVIKREFDEENLKVVEILTDSGKSNFSKISIETGIGWHNETETSRDGSFLIAQMKAKRLGLGIWGNGELYNTSPANKKIPTPLLRTMIQQNPFSPGVNYWVSSFGKIHNPECSFYERGRGELSRRPTGTDCRICGGRNP